MTQPSPASIASRCRALWRRVATALCCFTLLVAGSGSAFAGRWKPADVSAWADGAQVTCLWSFKLDFGNRIICGNDPVNRHDPLGLLEAESESLIRGIGYAEQGLVYSLNQLTAAVQARGGGWTPLDQYEAFQIQGYHQRKVSNSLAAITDIENAAEENRQIQFEAAHGWSRPSFGGSLVPLVGPIRGAGNNFQNGRWVRGSVDTGMAVIDATLVGAVVKAGGKAVLKGGSRLIAEALPRLASEATAKEICTAVKRELVHTRFEDFLVGRTFKSPAEANKAFAVYQQATKADKGILIGHGDDAIGQAFNGWQAFRIMERQWTPRINMAWIDGALDAGKAVRLTTPFDRVRRGTVTWDEIQRVISRGGTLISP